MDLDAGTVVWRLVLGLITGFTIGLTGVGGGVLVVPALAVLLKFSPAMAVGTASTYICLNNLYAAYAHWRLETIAFPQALLFLAGAAPGSIGTALVVKRFATSDAFQHGLGWFIIATISSSGLAMLINVRRKRQPLPSASQGSATSPRQARSLSLGRRIAGVLLGFLAGCLIGATSVGGGVIVIPALLFCFGLPIGRAIGSSIFIALALTLISAVIYYAGATSQVHLPTAILMALGSLGGISLGSRWSTRLSEQTLSSLVILMIAIAILAMTYRQLAA